MKKIMTSWVLLFVSAYLFAQTGDNPFAKYGYKKQIMYTSSKGEFEEFHDLSDVVEIGSILFNTKTDQIVGFVNEEKAETDVAAAVSAMSVDPLCEKYYWISPYAYCLNNPVRYVDPKGKDVWDYIKGVYHSIVHNTSVGIVSPKASTVSNADHYNAGRTAGDVLSIVTGAGETIDGSGAVIGGVAVTVGTGGTGTLVGGAAVVVGGVEVIHGIGTTSTALRSLATNEGRVSESSGQSNTSSSTKPSTQTSAGHATDQYGNKLGPSGKPQVNTVKHSSQKAAKDAARNEGKSAPEKHSSPQKGNQHYHPTDQESKKIPNSTHHEYP